MQGLILETSIQPTCQYKKNQTKQKTVVISKYNPDPTHLSIKKPGIWPVIRD